MLAVPRRANGIPCANLRIITLPVCPFFAMDVYMHTRFRTKVTTVKRHPWMALKSHVHTYRRVIYALGSTLYRMRTKELQKPPLDQQHQPLPFFSGTINDKERSWSTFEKTAYYIFQMFTNWTTCWQWSRKSMCLRTNRNLLFVYNSLAMEPALGRQIVSNVQRWALYLPRFMYTTE